MPNEGLIVPTHPTKSDYASTPCRRGSCIETSSPKRNTIRPMVLPLINDPSNGQNHMKIDVAAISVAVNAARQQIVSDNVNAVTAMKSSLLLPTSSSSSSSNAVVTNNKKFTNRRGSLDVNVEYAVAMVNIVDQKYDMDDRDMCAFGTRRDSVCGYVGGGKESPRARRRILKKKSSNDDENENISIINIDEPLPPPQQQQHQQQFTTGAVLDVVEQNDEETSETTATTAASTVEGN